MFNLIYLFENSILLWHLELQRIPLFLQMHLLICWTCFFTRTKLAPLTFPHNDISFEFQQYQVIFFLYVTSCFMVYKCLIVSCLFLKPIILISWIRGLSINIWNVYSYCIFYFEKKKRIFQITL